MGVARGRGDNIVIKGAMMTDKLTADRLAEIAAEVKSGRELPDLGRIDMMRELLEHIEALAAEKRPEWVWVVIPSLVFNREEDAVGVGYYDSAAAYAAAEEMDESTVLRVTVA